MKQTDDDNNDGSEVNQSHEVVKPSFKSCQQQPRRRQASSSSRVTCEIMEEINATLAAKVEEEKNQHLMKLQLLETVDAAPAGIIDPYHPAVISGTAATNQPNTNTRSKDAYVNRVMTITTNAAANIAELSESFDRVHVVPTAPTSMSSSHVNDVSTFRMRAPPPLSSMRTPVTSSSSSLRITASSSNNKGLVLPRIQTVSKLVCEPALPPLLSLTPPFGLPSSSPENNINGRTNTVCRPRSIMSIKDNNDVRGPFQSPITTSGLSARTSGHCGTIGNNSSYHPLSPTSSSSHRSLYHSYPYGKHHSTAMCTAAISNGSNGVIATAGIVPFPSQPNIFPISHKDAFTTPSTTDLIDLASSSSPSLLITNASAVSPMSISPPSALPMNDRYRPTLMNHENGMLTSSNDICHHNNNGNVNGMYDLDYPRRSLTSSLYRQSDDKDARNDDDERDEMHEGADGDEDDELPIERRNRLRRSKVKDEPTDDNEEITQSPSARRTSSSSSSSSLSSSTSKLAGLFFKGGSDDGTSVKTETKKPATSRATPKAKAKAAPKKGTALIMKILTTAYHCCCYHADSNRWNTQRR
jgi:hypothetical protein